MKNKTMEIMLSLDDMFLSEDELVQIKGGTADSVNCGAGCGVGCGAGCGNNCQGCAGEQIAERVV
jgi:hypothetical protein